LADQYRPVESSVVVPNFQGRQALDAWLSGHEAGLLLQGPDPDSPHPLLNGLVVAQRPAHVREPRRPLPNHLEATANRQPDD
jgi:hypothetical protein